jgi:hypothetical protein
MDIESHITARVKVVIAKELAKGGLATNIAPKLGLASQAVTHLLNGTQKKPGIALVVQIINKLGVNPLWLSGEIGEENEIIYSSKNYTPVEFPLNIAAEPNE